MTVAEARCTGTTARWCPIHGDCSCRTHAEAFADGILDSFRMGQDDVPMLSDPRCVLHAPDAPHGVEPA